MLVLGTPLAISPGAWTSPCVGLRRRASWRKMHQRIPAVLWHIFARFLLRDVLCMGLRAASAVVRYPSVCLSVCPPVTYVYSVETSNHILKLSSLSGRPTSFPYGNIPTGTLWWERSLMGVANAGEKSRFSTIISLYLGNNTRWGYSYYGTPIGTRVQSIEWCHFEWPWVSDLAKYSMTRSVWQYDHTFITDVWTMDM